MLRQQAGKSASKMTLPAAPSRTLPQQHSLAKQQQTLTQYPLTPPRTHLSQQYLFMRSPWRFSSATHCRVQRPQGVGEAPVSSRTPSMVLSMAM